MRDADNISDSAKQSAILAARQYHSQAAGMQASSEADSGSIGGGIDRAQRIASQLAIIADHASGLSDRLTGNGQTGEKGLNASAAPQSPGHVDALHLALSRQEMIVQRLRTALEEIERRIG